MKNTSFQGIILAILVLSFCSCTPKDDTSKVKAELASSTEKVTILSCEKLLDSPEDYEGQVINIDAICWGSSPSIDGKEILMSLDDQKLVGLQQAHVLVHFTKDQEREIMDIAENDPISLTAKVGTYEYGALRLLEPKVHPKKP